MEIARQASIVSVVTTSDTARALGSGDLAVLGTPRLIAWLEAATCAAVQDALDPGQTTVGSRVEVSHRAASPVGASVRATATLVDIAGRALTFEVVATDPDTGSVLGDGSITRAIVDRERFLARLAPADLAQGELWLGCFLWAVPGEEAGLTAYEDAVLALIPEHGGEVVQRIRTDCADGRPAEIQLFRFAGRPAMDGYLADPRRVALAPERDRVVARTELFPAEPLG